MRYRRYRHQPAIAGHDVRLQIDAHLNGWHSQLAVDGVPVARQWSGLDAADPLANHGLAATLPDGRELAVECGFNSLTGTGAAAYVDGRLVWESHPGRPIALPARMKALASPERRAQSQAQMAQLKRNWPAMACDIGIGLIFYAVAKFVDLPTAAIVSAVAGIALAVVQRFVTVDLLGGLARFGIIMGLISAGLAIAFQDDRAVMMRSTVMGGLTALAFLGDAALGGGWLGKGMANYMPHAMNPRRLALGMGLVGLVMAAAEQAVILLGGKDQWLTWTTFIETPVAFALIMLMLRWARA
jgi:intracellular septation protein A